MNVPDKRMNKRPDQIRALIVAEYERQSLNPYRFSKLLDGVVSKTTVYDFIAQNTVISTEIASAMLTALGLKITARK